MNDAHDNALDDKAILARLMKHPTRAYYGKDPMSGELVPLRCGECGEPVYYDYADNRYHHIEEDG